MLAGTITLNNKGQSAHLTVQLSDIDVNGNLSFAFMSNAISGFPICEMPVSGQIESIASSNDYVEVGTVSQVVVPWSTICKIANCSDLQKPVDLSLTLGWGFAPGQLIDSTDNFPVVLTLIPPAPLH